MKVLETDEFSQWFSSLRDYTARSNIANRIKRLAQGNSGDSKNLGQQLYELRVHIGPGYRVYFTYLNNALVVLLLGGDKSKQSTDSEKARSILERVKAKGE